MSDKSILPFVILFAGFAWYAVFAWLQRRANANAPTTTGTTPVPTMSLVGALGLLVAVTVAGVSAYRLW